MTDSWGGPGFCLDMEKHTLYGLTPVFYAGKDGVVHAIERCQMLKGVTATP